MTDPTATGPMSVDRIVIEREVPIDAAPAQVAAALRHSPWRSALRIEPAGSGARVAIGAVVGPPALAEVVEQMLLDELCRLRTAIEAAPTSNRPITPTEETRTMRTIDLSITVDRPPSAVWAVLADFGAVSVWNPTVKASHLTSEAVEGVGISRQCRLAPMGLVRERVTGWDPERAMTIEIYENEHLPGFRSGKAAFTLREVEGGRTEVGCRMSYSVGSGIVGATANALGLRRMFTRSLSRLLAGLKYHVETGRPVDGDARLDLGTVVAG